MPDAPRPAVAPSAAKASSAEALHPVAAPEIAGATLSPVGFGDLPGWAADDAAAAFSTFLTSCRAIETAPAEVGPASNPRLLPGLRQACRAARALGTAAPSSDVARLFFEANFRPYAIRPDTGPQGFLTGYYEPEVEGALAPGAGYGVPVYARPPDLIPGDAAAPSNKGPVFRLEDGRRVPYWDRAAIEDGALAGRGLEICWLKDPIDLFFMQIQGSARVRLPDGRVMRLNYDGHNGQGYVPVGRLLIERGLVPRSEMSMDRIRAFMEADPAAGRALRRENPSYVFFKAVPLGADEGALGAQGVGLTPGRSIAIDRALHGYGTPVFISARLPIRSAAPETPFQRLMIAQDTGSAIVGPARADLFFGAGPEAGRIAGRIRDPGAFFLLVPRLAGGTP
ncbi:murein transglycosylase A [Azorhizobium doebereinerae]|uniref:murein transglycosylase A n=1 Tax=Azorhizobium doebereinerae TaxID=281091 RepID=UPI000556C921|nr:MltA domain-containing protein [Azorhizobium doebereinerae]